MILKNGSAEATKILRRILLIEDRPLEADIVIADVVELRIVERQRFIVPDEHLDASVFGPEPPPPKFSSFARFERERKSYKPRLIAVCIGFRNHHFSRRRRR